MDDRERGEIEVGEHGGENTPRKERECSFRMKKWRSMGLAQTKGLRDSRREEKKGNAVHSHTAWLLTSPTPTITPQPPPNTQPLYVREEGHERESERKREPIPPSLIVLSHSTGPKVS